MNPGSALDQIVFLLNHNKGFIVIELLLVFGLALASRSTTGIIPIVCVIGFSFWLRKVAWRDIGFTSPGNLLKIALWGVVFGWAADS